MSLEQKHQMSEMSVCHPNSTNRDVGAILHLYKITGFSWAHVSGLEHVCLGFDQNDNHRVLSRYFGKTAPVLLGENLDRILKTDEKYEQWKNDVKCRTLVKSA